MYSVFSGIYIHDVSYKLNGLILHAIDQRHQNVKKICNSTEQSIFIVMKKCSKLSENINFVTEQEIYLYIYALCSPQVVVDELYV